MDAINTIENYLPIEYVNNSEPDLDADNLNHAEQALKRVTDAANEAIRVLGQLDQAKIDAAKIVNNLLATDPTTVLAAPQGKALGDRLTAAENLLTQLNGDLGHFCIFDFITVKNNVREVLSSKPVVHDTMYFCFATESTTGTSAAPPYLILIYARTNIAYTILGTPIALTTVAYTADKRLKFSYSSEAWPTINIYRY